MFLAAIDLVDVAFFIAKQTLIVLAIYLIILLLIKFSGYYRLKKCPECGHKLKRSSRSSNEHMAKTLSLGILPLKRYRCYSCYWEGSAFVIRKSSAGKSSQEIEDVEGQEHAD